MYSASEAYLKKCLNIPETIKSETVFYRAGLSRIGTGANYTITDCHAATRRRNSRKRGSVISFNSLVLAWRMYSAYCSGSGWVGFELPPGIGMATAFVSFRHDSRKHT